MPVELDMPWASLAVIAATGSPGIRRGRVKFSMKAKTKVTNNQTTLPRKYLRYPFKAAPPYDSYEQPCSVVGGTWLFILDYALLLDQRQVVETGDTPTVGHVERRDGRVGAIAIVREVRP